jgi:dTDP-4-amino-4,6-dideoxygalactose transaminase
VKRFEADFARYAGVAHAIAVSSCTAALHVTLAALNIGPGDEVIVPTLTFCATANVVVHLGATPVVVDIDREYQISLAAVEAAITPRTRAIIPVHYAGQACDLDELRALAGPRGIEIVEDAAHAAGSEYRGRKIGGHSRAAAFSFYATKNMTTGEGGMITTDDDALAARMRLLALHGMSHDAWKRYSAAGSWYYEVVEAGYKSNMTDIQAAIGIHQLRSLDGFIARRREIARRYGEAFAGMEEIEPPHERPDRSHTYHLYPIRLVPERLGMDRQQFIDALRQANIGTSVHFIPLHRHPFYQRKYGYRAEQFPVAEGIYSELLSLPLYPKMSDADVEDVIEAVRATVARAGYRASRAD